jgi:hypothetical protein
LLSLSALQVEQSVCVKVFERSFREYILFKNKIIFVSLNFINRTLKLSWRSSEDNFWRCVLVFEKRFLTSCVLGKRERSHGTCTVNGKTIDMGVKFWTGLNWVSSPIMGCCEHGNVTPQSIKCRQCVNQLRDSQSICQEEFNCTEFVVMDA